MAKSAFARRRSGRLSTKRWAGRSGCLPKSWRPSFHECKRPDMSRPVFYEYWRSSAAYRVRIALKLKGVEYESRQVDLRQDEQKSDGYRALNPLGLVPMLEIDGHRLTQSVAIINYLDLKYPVPPLIPAAAAERAHVVAMAMAVACDIHPLNNLRVLKYLKSEMGQPQEAIDRWYAHWVRE